MNQNAYHPGRPCAASAEPPRISEFEAERHDDGLVHPTLSELDAAIKAARALGDPRRANRYRLVRKARVLRAQRDARVTR